MMLRNNSNSKAASGCVYLDRMSEPCTTDYSNGVYVGRSSVHCMPFFLDLDALINRNISVLGMSGSGKSYFLKSFIIRSSLQRGSSVLIIDWNNEYKDIVAFLEGRTLTLGVNLRVNLFGLYDLGSVKNIRVVSDIISSALNLSDEENYSVYSRILTINSRKNAHLNLSILINSFIADGPGLPERLSRKLLQLKCNPLFADKTDFPVSSFLDGVLSINFSMLKDDAQRKETSRAIFRIIIELMHHAGIGAQKGRERIIILDEAWRLMENSSDVGVLFREGRKYGFCIAVATQLASDINNEVLSNTAALFLFRLQNESDYHALVECGIIGESDKRKVMQLHVGSCLVSIVSKDNAKRVNRFFIESVDGMVGASYNLIAGGKMKSKISYRLFAEATEKLQASREVKERLVNYVAENNNEIDDAHIVELLARLGVRRPEMVYYFRLLGFRDIETAKALGSTKAIT